MNNPKGSVPRRDEAIAFAVVGQVLGVEVKHADNNAVPRMPDGEWLIGDARSVLEVTSVPDAELMRDQARDRREGKLICESGFQKALLNNLAGYFTEMLNEAWARDNIDKLCAVDARERHLYIRALSVGTALDFHRLSDTYADGWSEVIKPLALPQGLTDAWFEGRAVRLNDYGDFEISVARYNHRTGWTKHRVIVREKDLPEPRIKPSWLLPRA